MISTEIKYPIKNALPSVNGNSEALVGVIANEVVKAGCVFRKNGLFEPSKTGLFVYAMSRAEHKERFVQMSLLHDVFNKTCPEMLGYEMVQEILGIKPEEVDLAVETNPLALPLVLYFGVDLCGPQLVINDLNTDRATIAGFQPEFTEVFGRTFTELSAGMTSFYHGLIPLIGEIAGKDKPRVHVLTEEVDPYVIPNTQFAKRFGFSVGGITQFDPSKVDLVFRAMKTEVILKDQPKYQGLINCLKSGLPMINPLGSYLAGNKGWPSVLVDCGYLEANWFPNLWMINKGKIVTLRGDQFNLQDALPKLLEGKNHLVAKKAFGAGGWEVHIGKDMKKWDWEKLILVNMRRLGESWVIEDMQPKHETEVTVGIQEKIGEEAVVAKKRLNIIERVYLVGKPNKLENLSFEVFGCVGSKVNASGYTFPVCLDVK